jgi:hypothetical protein
MPRTITIAVQLPCPATRLYRIVASDYTGVSEGWSKYYWVPWRQ